MYSEKKVLHIPCPSGALPSWKPPLMTPSPPSPIEITYTISGQYLYGKETY